MRTEEWTLTWSRVEAARQGRGRLDYFFYIFFIVNSWTTETSFISSIKYCYLQYPCRLLCNPTTWVNQINALKAWTQQNIARSKDLFTPATSTQAQVKCGRNSTRINTNTGESTLLFFLLTPIINALKAQVQENQTSSFFSSCAWTLILWISDDQEKNDCVPSSHVSAYALVVGDLTELNCTGFACVHIASIN